MGAGRQGVRRDDQLGSNKDDRNEADEHAPGKRLAGAVAMRAVSLPDVGRRADDAAQGCADVTVIGLGCMALAGAYGAAGEREAAGVLEKAIELGITHFDTADVYGAGANERVVEAY